MAKKQIPVIVLAGFLGSGKTTMLNHLLRNSRGNRIGAVVNDFGSVGIDAMTVAGQVDAMVSLGNGCLCCAVDTSDLDGILDRLARPAARLDAIVIEASGLAEPETMVRMILSSTNRHIVYGGLIEVVDAAEFAETRARHPEIDRHLGVADLVVLNKTDRIDTEEQERLLGVLAELSPGRPVVAASHGRLDPELLFERRAEREEAVRQLSFDELCGADDEHGEHLHAAYDSVAFSSPEPLDPRRFMEFLDSRPKGLYRIKGFVHFGVDGHRQKFSLHAVGDFLRFNPSPWARGERRTTHLVLIGSGIDAEALRGGLEACVQAESAGTEPGGTGLDGTEPDGTGARSMWGVLRYVQE
ncbi:CobW family GTP-binding protein [Streptomyces sp. bgisy100]|uniref:CobW family GTP-binding protein n=1 Tax=Streptomyces sp. bgisy100 TaxID=3413783 RepID=UPI003D71ADB4